MHEWYWVKKNSMMILNTNPEMTTMDLIMTTSRGRDLYKEMRLLPGHDAINPIFSVHPGSSFTFLTETAIEIINHSPYPNRNIHVYFVAGLIDLSEKITDINYREYICNDSFTDSFTHMRTLLDDTQEKITNTGATPCFATITPMHIDTSNHHLLHTHKTSYLLHFNHYDSMQENHIEATVLTNGYITLLNSHLNMHTPRLAQDILYKPSSRRPTHRFRHHVLPDGIHPDNTIKQKWAKTLLETISTNRYKHQ